MPRRVTLIRTLVLSLVALLLWGRPTVAADGSSSDPSAPPSIGVGVTLPAEGGGQGESGGGGGGSEEAGEPEGSAGAEEEVPFTCEEDVLQIFCPEGEPAEPDAVPVVDPVVVAQMALDSAEIALPAPHTSPDGVPQMTGLMTWFWIEPDAWAPVTARAELPGVWAEVTATPTTATWTPGDGGAAVGCAGPGAPHPGTAGARTDCGHTYVDVGAYTLTVEVTYEVAWTSSTGAGGALDPIVVSADLPVTVEQRQAVID